MRWEKNISIGLLLFLWFSDTSFGFGFDDPLDLSESDDPLDSLKSNDPLDSLKSDDLLDLFGSDDSPNPERTDTNPINDYLNGLKKRLDNNPLLDNPYVRIKELEANRASLITFLFPEERGNKFQERKEELRREDEKRKQLAANPEMKKNADAQLETHINWLKSLYGLSIEELEAPKKKIQLQLHKAQKNGDQNLVTWQQFLLNELNALLLARQNNMPKEAFEALCEWKQMTEGLPLDKWEEELRQNLDVIEDMQKANEENPEEFTRQIERLVKYIDITLGNLRATTNPLDFDSEFKLPLPDPVGSALDFDPEFSVDSDGLLTIYPISGPRSSPFLLSPGIDH